METKKTIVCLMILFFLAGCATPAKKDYQKIVYSRNENLYRDFLRKYPNTKYAEEIKMQLSLLEYQVFIQAKIKNTVEAYNEYLKRFPNGRYIKDIEELKNLLEKNEWEKAKRQETIEAIDQYLTKFPNGKYQNEAKSLKEKLLNDKINWERAKKENTLEAVEEYLKKFPDGKYKEEANNLKNIIIDKKAWERVLKDPSIESIKEYLKKFPYGRYTKEAKNLLDKIEQETWERAKKENTFTAYGKYIEQFPHGQYIQQAREEIFKSYKLNDEEIEKLAKLQEINLEESKKPEYVDKLIFTGADCLNFVAAWVDKNKGRKIYDMLKKYDSKTLTESAVRVVLIKIDRQKVLFLLVKLGIPGTESALNNLLMQYGDKEMAEDYLNSGSKELYEGAALWARMRGYTIFTGPGSHRVRWGQF